MSSAERISKLLFLHLRGELTGAEDEELENWRSASKENEALFLRLTDEGTVRNMMKEYYYHEEKGWDKLVKMAPELDLKPTQNKNKLIRITAIAASILLITVTAGLLWMYTSNTQKTQEQPQTGSKTGTHEAVAAILVLSDGKKIRIDNSPDGIVAKEGNISIIKNNGQLSYDNGRDALTDTLAYHTLEILRGNTLCIVLADHTKVWLNAGSQLRYPAYFIGRERAVELSGEGYFEVARDSLKPFTVLIAKQSSIKVLGTLFNVSAYPGEPSCVSLLEGKIKLDGPLTGHKPLIMAPHEQVRWDKNYKLQVFKGIDSAQILNWTKGLISFKDEDIETIMRKIARWYDVEIIYKGHFAERKFTGGIPANTSLTDLVNVFALYNIHLHINGKQVIVTP